MLATRDLPGRIREAERAADIGPSQTAARALLVQPYRGRLARRKTTETKVAVDKGAKNARLRAQNLRLRRQNVQLNQLNATLNEQVAKLNEQVKELTGLTLQSIYQGWNAATMTAEQTECTRRIGHLHQLSVELFEGSVESANCWFVSPCRGLGGKTPLEMAQTEDGARHVEQLIGRLEHGVFS